MQPCGLYPTRLLHPWDSPGKNTGVGCHFLLQGIFPTEGSNPGLLHCRQMLYPLNHLILCLYFLILVVCIFLSFLDKSTMTLDAFINIFKEFAFGSIDFSLSLICLIILLISALTLIIFFHHLLWIYFTLLFLASLDGTLDYCFF